MERNLSISEFSQSILGGVPTYTRPRIDSDQYINNMLEKFQDNPEIANQFKILGGFKSGLLNDARNNIINAYNIFEESTNPAFRNYMQTSLSQGSKMLSDIDRQRQQAEAYYGPGGEAERMIDDYVVKYGNLIAQQAQGSQALAKNVGTRAGGSQAAIRAGVSQQQAIDAENLIKFQEKRVGDLTNLYNIYNNLISSLRAESAGANQQFIIQPLAQALERQTQIAGALVQNEAQLNNMRIQMSMAASSGGSKNPMDIFNYFKSAGFSDEDATTMTNQLLGGATNTTGDNNPLTYNTGGNITPINTGSNNTANNTASNTLHRLWTVQKSNNTANNTASNTLHRLWTVQKSNNTANNTASNTGIVIPLISNTPGFGAGTVL